MSPPYPAQAELGEAVAMLGTLAPDRPEFAAHLVLALRAIARRHDELEERLERLLEELGG